MHSSVASKLPSVTAFLNATERTRRISYRYAWSFSNCPQPSSSRVLKVKQARCLGALGWSVLGQSHETRDAGDEAARLTRKRHDNTQQNTTDANHYSR